MFYNKICVLKNFGKFLGKHLYRSLFFKKLQASGVQLEFYKIFNDIFFIERLRATASENVSDLKFSNLITLNELVAIKYRSAETPIGGVLQEKVFLERCSYRRKETNVSGRDLLYYFMLLV